jgi:two-component system sensor histidine kinase RegB
MDRVAINLSWLLTLRWGAIAGQLALILLVSWGMGVDLPLVPLLTIIVLAALSNAVAVWWFRRGHAVHEWTPGAFMLADVLLLTALLYCSGGPYNPFSFLYLVNIALAAVVLSGLWTWLLVAVSLLCFGFLFLDHVSLPVIHDHGSGEHLSLHLQGMWVAFGVAACFIVYFVQRLTRALAARDAELAAARNLSARHERLASLATLAAGAAHQLATPLSTIAVVSKELERHLGRDERSVETIGDVRLIREQVERCREILLQMAADAGESTGEAIVPVTAKELVALAVQGVAGRERLQVELTGEASAVSLVTPVRSIAQALRALIKNALEASGSAPVRISVATRGATCQVDVRDQGIGMSSDVLAHAGEPFFTTKGPERGMGLGLFLCRTLVERIGGALTLTSAPQQGTTATMVLPLSAAPAAPPSVATAGNDAPGEESTYGRA